MPGTAYPIDDVELAASLSFFLITNCAFIYEPTMYPHTLKGMVDSYIAGIPFFWNTLAGDAVYAALLFGGYALAERLLPVLRPLSLKTDN